MMTDALRTRCTDEKNFRVTLARRLVRQRTPVKQSDVLLLQVRTAYFGTRPII